MKESIIAKCFKIYRRNAVNVFHLTAIETAIFCRVFGNSKCETHNSLCVSLNPVFFIFVASY